MRLVLAYKELGYTYVPVSITGTNDHQSPEGLKRNPMAQVPTLEITIGGELRHVSQSLAIIELLDERFPNLPVLPRDSYLRAHARQLAEIVNSGIQPFQNPTTTNWLRANSNADEKVWKHHFITLGLKALEESAAPHAGKFLVGDQFSIADACLIPQLYAARRFEVPIDAAAYPTLLRAEASAAALTQLDASHPSKQPDSKP